MKIKIWLSILSVVALSNIVTAQESPSVKKTEATGTNIKQPSFVDKNKDGICDNFAANQGRGYRHGAGKGQGLRNGNGKCNSQCRGRGAGANFVDANNNGICDHREKTVSD